MCSSDLETARQGVEHWERTLRPQLEESRQLEPRVERLDLAEQVLSLRPRDQIALARKHGAEVVDRAVQQTPELAVRTVAAREEWMRNLAPPLDRALDRQLTRRGLPSPVSGRASAAWLENALRRGLRPSHAIQALARAGVPLAETLLATSRTLSTTRAVIAHPVKSAVRLTAQAMGVPTLPLRLAALSWSLARTWVRELTR